MIVPIGERRALIGPNGAGKTTLFNTIAGELIPNEGNINLFGIDITRKSVQERANLGLGRTYQISQLFLNLRLKKIFSWQVLVARQKHFVFFAPGKKIQVNVDWVREVADQVGLRISIFLNSVRAFSWFATST